MNTLSDELHVKAVATRFGNLYRLERKDEIIHKQIIRLGSVLRFVQEWYDLHNTNRTYHKVWESCVQVLSVYSIRPRMIGRIIKDSENHLVLREGKYHKAQEMAMQLASFTNPIQYDRTGFLKEVTQNTHPLMQISMARLLFALIGEWADCTGSCVNNTQLDELHNFCAQIRDFSRGLDNSFTQKERR